MEEFEAQMAELEIQMMVEMDEKAIQMMEQQKADMESELTELAEAKEEEDARKVKIEEAKEEQAKLKKMAE